jgi:nucleotide-binding universal stress UspA family protein
MEPASRRNGCRARYLWASKAANLGETTEGDLMGGSIICGVDESASARGAAAVARGLSRKLGLRLVFVRVVDEGTSRERFEAAADSLELFMTDAGDADSSTQWRVETGHPADRLVAAAEDADASMIVVGSHGPRSSLLGSISAEVSRRAPCPVVVVPPGAEDGLSPGRAAPGDRDGRRVGNAGGIVRFELGARQT